MGRKAIDLSGCRFGKLQVLERAGTDHKTRNPVWRCMCECGRETLVMGDNLRRGNTKSCGCGVGFKQGAKNPNYRGGFSNSRLYRIWFGMKTRCENSKAPKYKDYGGRGIKICNEWTRSFENFRNWAVSNGYKPDLSIDRIDVNGNYEPKNCRWATAKQQGRNRRNNVSVEIGGDKRTVGEWEEANNLPHGIVYKRHYRGFSGESLIKPPQKSKK